VASPEFVVVGHVVRDLLSRGWRLGGTVTFAAVQAQRLGLRAGVVTRAGPELDLKKELPRITIAGRPAEQTTCFENVYEGGVRRQRIPLQAPGIMREDVPDAWREAPIALLGPVCGELPVDLGRAFTRGLAGVSAQGWLRRLDGSKRVRRAAWEGAPFWRGCRVLFVSDEDIGRRGEQLERWTARVPIVALTRYRKGARVHARGRWRSIAAFPAKEVDPTGAGDVFAAAFLVRYHETGETGEAARFASAAAACSVEGRGIERIATRREIEARMKAHPEIVLR
jgi:sugar/nucleoside kinase (ribokinase family)